MAIRREERAVRIAADGLMSNHVHLVAVGDQADAVSLFMMDLNGLYATYRNVTHRHTGRVWQGRFYSAILDAASLHKTGPAPKIGAGVCGRVGTQVWGPVARQAAGPSAQAAPGRSCADGGGHDERVTGLNRSKNAVGLSSTASSSG